MTIISVRRFRLLRHSPCVDHGGNEEELSRLRDERDRGARASGCARRAQAGASAHPLFDARERARAGQAYANGRASSATSSEISSAWRPVDLRRAGAHGAGFLDAHAADRRPGQFRFGRRRSARSHRYTEVRLEQRRRGAARRYRQGHRRLSGQLRQLRTRAGGVAGALSQSSRQRRQRHRGRDGDQYPAAQSRRGDRCLHRAGR